MQVTSATSAERTYAAATEGNSGTTTPAPKKTTLDQNDFLKLLTVQFQQQDPMSPMEDTQFIAQMAQFTALDQSKALLTQMKQFSAMQDTATANSYIGRQVTLGGENGETVTGVVSGVEITDGAPRLIVGDLTYALSAVRLVEPAPAPSDSTTTNP